MSHFVNCIYCIDSSLKFEIFYFSIFIMTQILTFNFYLEILNNLKFSTESSFFILSILMIINTYATYNYK